MRILLAFRLFFQVLFSGAAAEKARAALAAPTAPALEPARSAPAAEAKAAPKSKPPARSEALTLLAALQREARFVDLVQEPLADYADAQIGAAARDVLRDCGKVLARMFALEPLASEPEGAELTVPEGFDAAHYRLTGNVSGNLPLRGRLVHHGWRATRCEVPAWSGSDSAALVVSPVEVEIA